MIMKRYVHYLGGNQNSHQLDFYIFEHMYILRILLYLGIFYLICIRKTFFRHLPTFPINKCEHFIFDWRISVTMITLNISINICFKIFRYCTTIGRILIKINIYIYPQCFINAAFSFSWVNKDPFPNDAVLKSSVMKN